MHALDNLDLNKPVIGCFPLYPPLELFYACGLHPVVLWGALDPAPTQGATEHLQEFTCSVARTVFEGIVNAPKGALAGFFSYNACDTLRNLPEIVQAGLHKEGRALPFLHLHVPQVPLDQTNARQYLRDEITRLITALEETFHSRYDPKAFHEGVLLYQRVRELCNQLDSAVHVGRLSFKKFTQVVAAKSLLPVKQQIEDLQSILDHLPNHPPADQPPSFPVLLSGIQPPPQDVTTLVEKRGFRVVGNDIGSLGRSYHERPALHEDPGEYYEHYYFDHEPCPTLLYTGDRRLAHLQHLIERTGARGVIFVGEKYCEHEYFEYPFLQEHLGVPTLLLEFSPGGTANLAGYENRLEAFQEVLTTRQEALNQ